MCIRGTLDIVQYLGDRHIMEYTYRYDFVFCLSVCPILHVRILSE